MSDAHNLHEPEVLINADENTVGDPDLVGPESFEFGAERLRRPQRVLGERAVEESKHGADEFGVKRPRARAAGRESSTR